MLQSALSKRLGLHFEIWLKNNSINGFSTGDFCLIGSAGARIYSNQLFLSLTKYWNRLQTSPLPPPPPPPPPPAALECLAEIFKTWLSELLPFSLVVTD